MKRYKATLTDNITEIRKHAHDIDEQAALVIRTASYSSAHDGMARGGHSSGDDEDGDVVLTTVEAAAIASPPLQPERDQALAILQFVETAESLMARAAEFSHRLHDRIPKEIRDAVAVTCVDESCEKLRSDGWDDDHPNGKAGRCSSCYQRRNRSRRNE